jgi:glycerophosphoryl diester phosphodiesterase
VELDVRRTSDGRLVVHHDAEIPGVGAIHALPAGALPSWVPGLEEALETCAGSTVNVEVKNSPMEPGYDSAETVATDVAGVVTRALTGSPGRAPAQVIVSSFWPATLAAVRAAGAELSTGLLVHPALDVVAAADQASALGCVALHPFHAQVTPELVDRVQAMDMSVVAWTVNEPEDLSAVAAAGVDVVISDRVTDARAVLRRG